MPASHSCCVYLGEELARYSFGYDHPFGPLRHDAFRQALYAQALEREVDILHPVATTQETLELFHDHAYIETVKHRSKFGNGYLDQGDTPAFVGMYEAVLAVAGTVCNAVDRLIGGDYRTAFVPIAGLHHARRHVAAGFCVVNDCGIAIEYLREQYGIKRVAYIDIDAHHGDGVFYGFENDPRALFADIHEDGRYLYPGTGSRSETGRGAAEGTKLNIPMPPGADDGVFLEAWQEVEDYLAANPPELLLLNCGADSLQGDPITHLAYSENAHGHAATRLRELADEYCDGRVLGMGGGGYNRDNLARAWTRSVEGFIDAPSALA